MSSCRNHIRIFTLIFCCCSNYFFVIVCYSCCSSIYIFTIFFTSWSNTLVFIQLNLNIQSSFCLCSTHLTCNFCCCYSVRNFCLFIFCFTPDKISNIMMLARFLFYFVTCSILITIFCFAFRSIDSCNTCCAFAFVTCNLSFCSCFFTFNRDCVIT